MSIFKRGKFYWYEFEFDKDRIRESSGFQNRQRAMDAERDRRLELRTEYNERQKKARELGCDSGSLRRCAECEKLFRASLVQLEADAHPWRRARMEKAAKETLHCSDYCKDRWRKKQFSIPTLKDFITDRVELWAKAQFEITSPKTWTDWYRANLRTLRAYLPLAEKPLDQITGEDATGFAAHRQSSGRQVSSVNSSLRMLRRIMRLAVEWGVIATVPKIKLLRGERHRERVITPEEEARYLAAAPEPLASVATTLVDSGMRPEECFRLRWESVTWANRRHGTVLVTHGKTAAARRMLPMTPRVRAILESRWNEANKPQDGWIWPAPTKSGHIEPSTLKKQHAKTFATIAKQAAENNLEPIRPFVLYTLRHTFLTRLGQSGCDVWTLARIAGHSSIGLSARYVHPSEDAVLAAIGKLPEAKPPEPSQPPQRPRLPS